MSTDSSAETGTEPSRLRTVPAREIKRRGIGAVDELLKHGAVHVIKEDRPRYVVLTEALYEELVDGYQEAYVARVRAALQDAKVGRVKRFAKTDDLMRAIDAAGEATESSAAAREPRAPNKRTKRVLSTRSA